MDTDAFKYDIHEAHECYHNAGAVVNTAAADK